MRAGPLRYRVRIDQLVAGSPQQKPTGEPDKAWSELATVWADIRPLRGEALFLAQQAESRVAVEIDIRWSSQVSGITAGMRAVDVTSGNGLPGTIYDLLAVPPRRPSHGRPFTLSCASGLNQG